MLSCSCDFDDGGWYYYPPSNFSTFNLQRRKRCCSCGVLIDVGSQCVKFTRCRPPISDIDESINGSEVPLAPWYMCEWCGEMFFNLHSLGYCIVLGDDIKEKLEDYWKLTADYRK